MDAFEVPGPTQPTKRLHVGGMSGISHCAVALSRLLYHVCQSAAKFLSSRWLSSGQRLLLSAFWKCSCTHGGTRERWIRLVLRLGVKWTRTRCSRHKAYLSTRADFKQLFLLSEGPLWETFLSASFDQEICQSAVHQIRHFVSIWGTFRPGRFCAVAIQRFFMARPWGADYD